MAQLTFGTPENLGPSVNTTIVETSPTITTDGLSLLFHRYTGPNAPIEILEATRSSTAVPFENVVSAGAEVNSAVYQGHPAVSEDGLTLLYSNHDNTGLYQATRTQRNVPFSGVTSLGDILPGQPAHSPSLSADGLTLFFTAWDTNNIQNDIYQATRPTLNDPWGNVVMLGLAINVPGYNDAQPSISADGLMLFFNSNRAGGFGDFDLYVSKRESLDAPWDTAVNLGPQVNTVYDDKGPEISADGNLLYFDSNRPGGAGAEDVYQVAILGEAPDAQFYVVNDGGNAATDHTYEYDDAGTPGESYSVATGNTAPRGAASTAAGDKVWVIDANKNVYVYDPTGALLGSWSASGLHAQAQVEGVATNGNDVWIVDAKSDKVYRYAGAASRLSGSQNAANSFALNSGNRDPKDIVTDGVHLWVVNDSATDKVFKYTLSGSLVGSWTINSGGGSPTGIAIDPSNVSDIWIVDNNTDRVYQFIAAASRTSGSQSPATSFALAAGNTNAQGIADPPVLNVEPGAPSLLAPEIGVAVNTTPFVGSGRAARQSTFDLFFATDNEDWSRRAQRIGRAMRTLHAR